MKKIIFLLTFVTCFIFSYAQWSSILTLKSNEYFVDISAHSNKNIWAIANDQIVYNTVDGGKNWQRIHPKGLAQYFSFPHLYAINDTTALLSLKIDSSITRIYRTSDGGYSWTQVFSHHGFCDIKMGMFNNHNGLMSCKFSNNGFGVQQLYCTSDGGNSWYRDTLNPSNDIINDLVIKDSQVCIVDYNYFYFSADKGLSWTKQKRSSSTDYYNHLQFVDSNYAIVNGGSLIDLFVKRPGRAWIEEGDPTGISGAVTAMILDSSECWLSMAFDTNNYYYSSDSAKTFTPFIVDSISGFTIMTKATKGRAIFGTTIYGPGRLWANLRNGPSVAAGNHQSTTNNRQLSNKISDQLHLQQNIPNPFNHSSTISFYIPSTANNAMIVITDFSGKTIKQFNNLLHGNGTVTIDAGSLSSGSYLYTLIIDGKKIATKQMVLTR